MWPMRIPSWRGSRSGSQTVHSRSRTSVSRPTTRRTAWLALYSRGAGTSPRMPTRRGSASETLLDVRGAKPPLHPGDAAVVAVFCACDGDIDLADLPALRQPHRAARARPAVVAGLGADRHPLQLRGLAGAVSPARDRRP